MRATFVALLAALSPLCPFAAAQYCQPHVELGAATSTGASGNGPSHSGQLSGDGRWFVFASSASDLVPGDTNGARDVFLREVATGALTLVSRGLFGALANDDSNLPSISDDGSRIAFESTATNLVFGDTNGVSDIFVLEVATGVLQRASVGFGGLQSNGPSWVGNLSANGRYVAFQTLATNLTAFPDPNGQVDVYVRDLQAAGTLVGSFTWDEQWGDGASILGQITSDGRYLVFQSYATNMSILDTNLHSDVFVRDFASAFTEIVSVTPGGLFPIVGNAASEFPSISDDGRYVAFSSAADNLAGLDFNGTLDVFLRDRVGDSTVLVSRVSPLVPLAGNGASFRPDLSADGRWIGYESRASDLVLGDTNGQQDIFLFDGSTVVSALVSVANVSGSPAGDLCTNASISNDGRLATWDSAWSGFVSGDDNGQVDAFVHWSECFEPTVFCVAKTASNGCLPSIGWNGAAVASATGGFHLTASSVINQKPGLVFYGLSGAAVIPFQGGFLCVMPPLRRSTIVTSGGSPSGQNDCTGVFDLDMDAYAAGALGGTPLPELLIPGESITAQWWGRDPGFQQPNNTMLSNAMIYTVLP